MKKLAQKKFDIVTIGGATVDIIAFTKEGEFIQIESSKLIGFPYGGKVAAEQTQIYFGGGACNAAVSAIRLGLKVAAILSIGEDQNGEEIIKHLKKEGVDVSFILKTKEEESGFSYIIEIEGKDHIIFTHRGANEKIHINKKLLQKINTPWLYLASLYEASSYLNKLGNFCQKNKINIAWAPGSYEIKKGPSHFRGFLKTVSVMSLNRSEALSFAFLKNHSLVPENTEGILKTLKKMGPKIIIMTDGVKGAYLINQKGEILWQPAIQVKTKETTGAGDAFASTFVSLLINLQKEKSNFKIEDISNKEIKYALLGAAINAASVVKKLGAQNKLLKLDQLKKKISQLKI